MSRYQRRLDSIIEREGCNTDEAAAMAELEFAHEDITPCDPCAEEFEDAED